MVLFDSRKWGNTSGGSSCKISLRSASALYIKEKKNGTNSANPFFFAEGRLLRLT